MIPISEAFVMIIRAVKVLLLKHLSELFLCLLKILFLNPLSGHLLVL